MIQIPYQDRYIRTLEVTQEKKQQKNAERSLKIEEKYKKKTNKKTNMEEILAVTNTTEVVVKIRPGKNSDPYGI